MKHLHSASELTQTLKNQPVYCETLQAGDAINTFLSEPVNAYSNVFIFIAFGVLAYIIKKSGVNKAYLWACAFLLLLNAIGSWLWHSTKDTFWLPLDVFPAILLLMILIYHWVMNISQNKRKAIAVITSVSTLPLLWVAFVFGILKPANPLVLPLGFLAIMLSIFAYLIWQTKRYAARFFPAALLLFAVLLLSALFRSIDIPLCHVLSSGTHWLWHLGLSVSVVLAFWFMIKLEKAKQ